MPWSIVHTKYSIHPVQHTLSTAYTEYCLYCVLQYTKINCLPHPPSLSTLGRPCCTQFCTFAHVRVNHWIESQLPSHLHPELPPPEWLPPSSLPILLDYGLQVHLQSRSITATMAIPKLARLQPRSWHTNGSKCISKLARWKPPRLSPDSLDYGLQVHTFTAYKCISKLARSQPPSVSWNTLDYSLHVRRMSAAKCISKLGQSHPPNTSLKSDSGCTQIQG